MVSPEAKRTAVAHLRQAHGASERRACGLVGQPRSTERHRSKPAGEEESLCNKVRELAAEWPRFGYRRLTALLRRGGTPVWHGRVHRITKEPGLQVPRRRRRRIVAMPPPEREIIQVDQRWGNGLR